MLKQTTLLIALAGLAACGLSDSTKIELVEPEVGRTRIDGPVTARPGSCWAYETKPAVLETTTEGIASGPLGDALRQTGRLVEDRKELWFETPCPEQVTEEFTATLQRALAIRGHYDGAVSGVMGTETRQAIQSYQRTQGLDSSILSIAASRTLGLLPYETTGGPAEEPPA